MAKKNKELEAVDMTTVSKWDGRALNAIGMRLAQLLVFGVFALAGIYVACMNIVGKGGTWIEDLQNPTNIIMLVVGIAIFGIGFCWANIIGLKYRRKHTIVCGQRMKFNTNTWNLFWNCVKWFILSVITVGIYLIWLPTKVRKWTRKHTVSEPVEVEGEEEEEEENVVQYPIKYFTVDDDGNYEEMKVDLDED